MRARQVQVGQFVAVRGILVPKVPKCCFYLLQPHMARFEHKHGLQLTNDGSWKPRICEALVPLEQISTELQQPDSPVAP
eukprot:g32147.t1